ncbi:recombinase family protein [Iningainema tapete]|uniref:Recombinase family protein n=1 Tax=Iningainema tapete BLCC-T55 TaxID=2748662 RepID=A0A8J6XKD2_9CYAN|nr:recombinase family protein [Iningainema tapete BLCC-T55]
MVSDSLWLIGPSRSGKTSVLVNQLCRWIGCETSANELLYNKNGRRKNSENVRNYLYSHHIEVKALILAANEENRRDLADKIVTATQGKYPVRCKTPLGFFQDEVILFWPVLIQVLQLKAQFPVRLRPETEQELATKLWRDRLDEELLQRVGMTEYRLVRRILDLLQLAAYSGTPSEEIGDVLAKALTPDATNLDPEFLASLLLEWRNWCLERGLLTYGIVTELYHQHLLLEPNYQQQLTKRYQAVLADDVQDYPAVARHLFDLLLDNGAVGAFSYNLDGTVRLGLGADPGYLSVLASRCRCETLTQPAIFSLANSLIQPMEELLTEQIVLSGLPSNVQSIQTTSRALLLRQSAELIVDAIKNHQVQPDEIAIIAPGLDAIARYTLIEILSKQNIPVESLNDQRPLVSSPLIRGLLTTLALVYPGLGRLVNRDAVAEMLVVLSGGIEGREAPVGRLDNEGENIIPKSHIDPVRAGLIADYCFVPHPDHPNLLKVTAFDRWDRLGYGATTAYGEILEWLEKQRTQQEMRLIPSPISLIDRTIQRFLWNGSNLPYDQLAALRELLETAQHYWEIDTRLKQTPHSGGVVPHNTIAEFIQLLQRGTITANPYPVRPIGQRAKAVTLATIFQYRSSRRSHRWHFWLDAGSPLWAKGGAATLFGAPFFLRDRYGEPWTAEDEKQAEEQRLQRILADLLSRVSQTIYLCHSDLAVNGQEQQGPLLPLVNACVPVVSPTAVV